MKKRIFEANKKWCALRIKCTAIASGINTQEIWKECCNALSIEEMQSFINKYEIKEARTND